MTFEEVVVAHSALDLGQTPVCNAERAFEVERAVLVVVAGWSGHALRALRLFTELLSTIDINFDVCISDNDALAESVRRKLGPSMAVERSSG